MSYIDYSRGCVMIAHNLAMLFVQCGDVIDVRQTPEQTSPGHITVPQSLTLFN